VGWLKTTRPEPTPGAMPGVTSRENSMLKKTPIAGGGNPKFQDENGVFSKELYMKSEERLATVRKALKKYYQKNKKKCKERQKDFIKKNPTYQKEYREKNPELMEHNRIQNKKRGRKWFKSLSDPYIKRLLITRSNVSKETVTPELIELKRQQLSLYRAIREANNDLRPRD
jgi:hypothetical protein